MKGPREHALGLLEKASHDLVAATATIATGEALDTVCFHAQQAAEKSLKALLASLDVVYPWRHDMGELLALVAPRFADVASLEEDLLALSPYAVAVRYDDSMSPDMEEASAALETAERVHALARELITLGKPSEDDAT